ncbi:MAG: MMPL family transporter, partial [Rhodopirellula sp.]|nr:MMPL family transporter [Rhodopirellula sp.]
MTHFLDKKDPWGHGMGLWVLVLFACALPPALWALSGIELDNDIRKWIPEDDPNAQTLAWYQENFPHNESIIVTWDGSTLNDPRTQWLADRLAGVPDQDGVRHGGLQHVERVVTPQSLLRRIEDDGVSHKEALQRLQGVLLGTGSLKLQLTELGQEREKSTLKTLQDRVRAELGIELEVQGPVKDWVPEKSIDDYPLAKAIVPIDEEPEPFESLPDHHAQIRWAGMLPYSKTAQRVIEIAEAVSVDGAVSSDDETGNDQLIEDAFFAPGSPLTVAVILSDAGEADKKGAISELRRIAAEVGIPKEGLHLGGRPVAGRALNDSVKLAAWNRDFPIWNLPGRSIILFSGVVGIILAFVMLRSAVLATLVLFVSYYTVLLTVAVVPATGGSMNMVLVVMPTLLLVLTMSGAIHVASYWRFAAKTDLASAPVTAARLATRPCALASLTTAFGLLSLATSPLAPVAHFGMYAAFGCFVGLGAILYGLPALLQFVPEKAARPKRSLPDVWQPIGSFIVRHSKPVGLACLLLFAVCSAGLTQFGTETKVIRFFPETAQVVKDYRFIEENTGGVIPVDVIIRFAESHRAPAADGLLFGERQEIVRKIQQKLVERHGDITGAISLATFRKSESDEALQRKASNPFLRKIDTQTELKVMERSAARSFITMADEDRKTADGVLCETGDELWRITAQVNIMTDVDYGVLLDEISGIVQEETLNHTGANYVVTGMVPLFLETQRAVLSSLIKSFLIAFVVIGIVISLVLKSARAGLATMLPNVLPISTVFGAISWFNIKVDIGTMITASVALGIAVDGTLHLLTWFREGLRRGLERHDAVISALSHCGPALFQTSVAVGIGLAVLMPAELTLISRFGWLMAAMIMTALFADLVMLPAMLAGWLGKVIAENEQKMIEAEQTALLQTSKREPAEIESGARTVPEIPKTAPPTPHV